MDAQGLPQRSEGTRTGGKILLRNCAKTRYVQHTAYALTHRKWRSKVSRPLMNEGPVRFVPKGNRNHSYVLTAFR